MRVTIAGHGRCSLLQCPARLAAELGYLIRVWEGSDCYGSYSTRLGHLCNCMISQLVEKLCLVAVARVASASSRCLCDPPSRPWLCRRDMGCRVRIILPHALHYIISFNAYTDRGCRCLCVAWPQTVQLYALYSCIGPTITYLPRSQYRSRLQPLSRI